ncbi:MAG: hypothetical protein R3301_05565 [Saprospiraceae bacterium]|nr:hypothetical protein [Saprospiraceae bacterium]
MTTSEFDNYIIYHESKPNSIEKAVITCFMGEKTVGYIHFYDGAVPEPEVLPTGVMRLCFHFDRLPEIINTIRYEKPLYISLYEDKSVLSTIREPVGEQEGSISPAD